MKEIFAPGVDVFGRNFDDERLFEKDTDTDIFRFNSMFTDIVTIEIYPGFFIDGADQDVYPPALPVVADIENGTVKSKCWSMFDS